MDYVDIWLSARFVIHHEFATAILFMPFFHCASSVYARLAQPKHRLSRGRRRHIYDLG